MFLLMLRILVSMTLFQIFLIWLYEWSELINLVIFYSISVIKNEKRHLVDVDTHSTAYVQNQSHNKGILFCSFFTCSVLCRNFGGSMCLAHT